MPSNWMKYKSLKQYFYLRFVTCGFLFCMGLFFHGLTDPGWRDFDVWFYIPLAAGFSSACYLLTLLIFILGIWKAHKILSQSQKTETIPA